MLLAARFTPSALTNSTPHVNIYSCRVVENVGICFSFPQRGCLLCFIFEDLTGFSIHYINKSVLCQENERELIVCGSKGYISKDNVKSCCIIEGRDEL